MGGCEHPRGRLWTKSRDPLLSSSSDVCMNYAGGPWLASSGTRCGTPIRVGTCFRGLLAPRWRKCPRRSHLMASARELVDHVAVIVRARLPVGVTAEYFDSFLERNRAALVSILGQQLAARAGRTAA